MYNSSKFGPPKQHDVTLLTGILTVRSNFPVEGSQRVTREPSQCATQSIPCNYIIFLESKPSWSIVIPSGHPSSIFMIVLLFEIAPVSKL